jgi:hypothetical protein
MSQSALPVATPPRTITVRVRTLGIVAAVAAVIGVVWWALSWASGVQPLAVGAVGIGAVRLPVAQPAPTFVDGPATYRWHRGGRYILKLDLHNSASVPVTVTGVDASPGGKFGGTIAGPRLRNSTLNFLLQPGPFRSVRIPADGERAIALIYSANPQVTCVDDTGALSLTTVRVHFTTLGVFNDTQEIPLGSAAPVMTDRRC